MELLLVAELREPLFVRAETARINHDCPSNGT